MKLTRRFSNYCDFGKQEPVEIQTLDDLQAIDWIQEVWIKGADFKRLSWADFGHPDFYREILMAELTTGKYWAIAYIDEGKLADLGLSEWQPRE